MNNNSTHDSEPQPQESKERPLSPWEQNRLQRDALRREMFEKIRETLNSGSSAHANSQENEIVVDSDSDEG